MAWATKQLGRVCRHARGNRRLAAAQDRAWTGHGDGALAGSAPAESESEAQCSAGLAPGPGPGPAAQVLRLHRHGAFQLQV